MTHEASYQKVFLRVLGKLGDECLWGQTPPRRLPPLLLLLLPLLLPLLLLLLCLFVCLFFGSFVSLRVTLWRSG